MFDYEGVRRVVYSGEGEAEGATFVPVCSTCGRFVREDKTIEVTGGDFPIVEQPNAT